MPRSIVIIGRELGEYVKNQFDIFADAQNIPPTARPNLLIVDYENGLLEKYVREASKVVYCGTSSGRPALAKFCSLCDTKVDSEGKTLSLASYAATVQFYPVVDTTVKHPRGLKKRIQSDLGLEYVFWAPLAAPNLSLDMLQLWASDLNHWLISM